MGETVKLDDAVFSAPPAGPVKVKLDAGAPGVTELDAVASSIVEYGGQVYPHTRVSYRVDEDSPRIESVYCTDPDGVRLELMEFFS